MVAAWSVGGIARAAPSAAAAASGISQSRRTGRCTGQTQALSHCRVCGAGRIGHVLERVWIHQLQKWMRPIGFDVFLFLFALALQQQDLRSKLALAFQLQALR